MDLHLTDEQAELLLATLDRFIENDRNPLSHRALTDEEKAALLNLLLELMAAEPLSPRVQMLRAILGKLRSPQPDPPPQ